MPIVQHSGIHWPWRVVGLFGTLVAWLVQINGSEILSSRACYPNAVPLNGPLYHWLYPALAGISIVCFIIGAFSAAVAWWRVKHEARKGRARFLSLMSAISSAIFIVAILFTACNLLLVSPC